LKLEPLVGSARLNCSHHHMKMKLKLPLSIYAFLMTGLTLEYGWPALVLWTTIFLILFILSHYFEVQP